VSKSLEQTKAGLRVKSTKSEDPRELGVPEWALEVLKQHRTEQRRDRAMFGAYYVDNNLIFCQPGGQYYSPDRLGARVAEPMRKSGRQGVSLHFAAAFSCQYPAQQGRAGRRCFAAPGSRRSRTSRSRSTVTRFRRTHALQRDLE
jgi:hypothetical protein